MSGIAQFLLQQAFSLINAVIISEGPAALAWIQAEIASIEARFAPPPVPGRPSSPSNPVA